jgi:hypothetical protein
MADFSNVVEVTDLCGQQPLPLRVCEKSSERCAAYNRALADKCARSIGRQSGSLRPKSGEHFWRWVDPITIHSAAADRVLNSIAN